MKKCKILSENFNHPLICVVTGACSGSAAAGSHFTLNDKSLTFTAVPEPTGALVGLLVGAGMLRRRRTA